MTLAGLPPTPPEDPPGFIVATEAQKAAFARSFRLERGADGPWLRYASTSVPGEVWLAGRAPTGPWWLAVSHPGVAVEFGPAAAMPGPGAARFGYGALDKAYRLARSLPTLPLADFQQRTAGLLRTTEAERLTVERIGQGVFRQALLDYWGGRCLLTRRCSAPPTSSLGPPAGTTPNAWTSIKDCCCPPCGMPPSTPGWRASGMTARPCWRRACPLRL